MSSDVTGATKFPQPGSSSSLMNLHSSFTPLVFHAVAFLVRTPWRHLTPVAPTRKIYQSVRIHLATSEETGGKEGGEELFWMPRRSGE